MKISAKELLSVHPNMLGPFADPDRVGEWRVCVFSTNPTEGTILRTTVSDRHWSYHEADEECERIKHWLDSARVDAAMPSTIKLIHDAPLSDHFPLDE